MKTLILLCLIQIMTMDTKAQQVMDLYVSKTIPGALPNDVQEKSETGTDGILRMSQVSWPTLTYFSPAKETASKAAVIICPGGGYGILAIGHEGYDVAKMFASWGIHAFVLKYRLPNPALQSNPSFAPLQDAQEAIRLVRSKAASWQIDQNKIGIMGFSAGGHLASTASTHFNTPVLQSNISCQPNASILIYPVISFTDSLTHKGSRQNLLGKTFTAEQVISFSNELQVQANTSPAFLVHSGDDGAVPVGNSLAYYQALQRHNIPAELHVYPKGGHGYGMNNKTTADKWMERLANWLKGLGWMK
jgi:acetyl esterase/lipase